MLSFVAAEPSEAASLKSDRDSAGPKYLVLGGTFAVEELGTDFLLLDLPDSSIRSLSDSRVDEAWVGAMAAVWVEGSSSIFEMLGLRYLSQADPGETERSRSGASRGDVGGLYWDWSTVTTDRIGKTLSEPSALLLRSLLWPVCLFVLVLRDE